MASDFLSLGKAQVQKAVACDVSHDYRTAYNCYIIAIDYFEMAIKREKSSPRRKAIRQRVEEYKLRVGIIETFLFDKDSLQRRIAELEREVEGLRKQATDLSHEVTTLREALEARDSHDDAKGTDET